MINRLRVRGLLLLAIGIALLFALPDPFLALEDHLLILRYKARGEQEADSNIVLLYFDHDDLSALGGWPLRRNVYALLIDVLNNLDASAIGFDILFSEEHAEFPEYDELLTATVRRAGNVVLPAYFRDLTGESSPGEHSEIEWSGTRISLPFEKLRHAAAGIGHSNMTEHRPPRIPVFVSSEGKRFPAFGLEVMRVSLGAGSEHVATSGEEITVSTGERSLRLPFPSGLAHLNFPGSFSTFRTYRCVDILRSYNLAQSGLKSPVDLGLLRNKLVLIGVVAEGRSAFLSGPFGRNMPAMTLHATFLDNVLQDRFLTRPGLWFSLVAGLILTLLTLLILLQWAHARGLLIVTALLAAYGLGSLSCFALFALVVPVVQPVLMAVLAAIWFLLEDRRKERHQLVLLQEQQRTLRAEVRERELKLQLLEREIMEGEEKTSADPLEEIRRYKKEIRELSGRLDDLVQTETPESDLDEKEEMFENIVYRRGGAMEEAVRLIERIASSDAPVLILGESGTGKELVAKAIHRRSARYEQPFVVFNCAAIPEALLESELFGYVKGAFTGAYQDKKGLFETADGGTIFLDEIAETTPAFQGKLLRTLQEGEIQPVGATSRKHVNVRVVAATNKEIRTELKEQRFREDFFFRLNTITIQLPPLRERRSDIPLLTAHFLRREAPEVSVSSAVMDVLTHHSWPGNVRELESVIKRAVIFARSERRNLIRLKDLPEELATAAGLVVDIEERILDSLRAKGFSRNSISETADDLGGLNRGTVAEYYRGICFRTFFEKSWDLQKTAREIAGTEDSTVVERVSRKVQEYLGNVVESIPSGLPFDSLKDFLRAKYKNLPQRYHPLLDEVLRAYLDGKWIPGRW